MEEETALDRRLWDYIDGNCPESERKTIAQLVSTNGQWQSRYDELMGMHNLLNQETLDTSLRFSKNVMDEITQYQVAPATKNYINKHVIQGITAFFLLMIAGLVVYFIGQLQWTGEATDNLLGKYKLDSSKLNWGKLLNNSYINIFIGINVILGLILADKYMEGKKKTGSEKRWTKGDTA